MATCGTGGWVGPLPGDPDNNSILSAVPAFGGIDVSYTYPNVNPEAVAYAMLYRGITPVFEQAIHSVVMPGNTYYDKIDSGTTYYYWIRIVSVNGTLGDVIGPASAMARPLIQDLIAALTNQIDQGLLAQSLKAPIDNIALNYAELLAEIQARAAGDAALSAALLNVQNGIDQALAFISSETASRISGDSALITQTDTQAALNAQTAAALTLEQTARVNGDSGLATQIAAVTAANTTTAAAVATETTARIAGDDALASQITTAQTTLNGQIASVQTTLAADITAIDGEVTNIGALYTAKVQVDGLVGGFGIYNTGAEVQAGFDVDKFWIGRTGASTKKPFMVVGTETFIDDAVINKLTFSKLRDEAGAFIVENGKVKADYLTAQSVVVKNGAGTIVLQDGVGTFSGPISGSQFTTGAFTGYAWPPAGAGNIGSYLGPSGLLIGNANNGKYLHVTSEGNMYAPGFKVENGTLTIDQANVINTLNIGADQVTVPRSVTTTAAFSTASTAWVDVVSLWIDSAGAPIWVIATGNAPVFTTGASDNSTTAFLNIRVLANGELLMTSGDYGSFSMSKQIGGGGITLTLQAQRVTINGVGIVSRTLNAGATLFAIGTKR